MLLVHWVRDVATLHALQLSLHWTDRLAVLPQCELMGSHVDELSRAAWQLFTAVL
jgi:hypothetical protein